MRAPGHDLRKSRLIADFFVNPPALGFQWHQVLADQTKRRSFLVRPGLLTES